MASNMENYRNLLRIHREQLLQRENVVATGIGFKTTGGTRSTELSIVCSVTHKVEERKLPPQARIPRRIDGLDTDVVPIGIVRALQAPTGRFRPALGGVSIGHYLITAGTLGCLVKKNGEWRILSNNHVLANSNDAQIGDAILQPGPHDGGRNPDDHIAALEQFVPISFIGGDSDCATANNIAGILNTLAEWSGKQTRMKAISSRPLDNLVDAAIARPLEPGLVENDILGIGTPEGTVRGELGMKIRKSGRTTGLTTGEIMQVDVSVNVQYGQGRAALFTDQLMAGGMSQGGDSGSAVLDDNKRLVGLLFAGSDQSTIINRIENVFSSLSVSL